MTEELLGVCEVTFFLSDLEAGRTWLCDLLDSEPTFDHPEFKTFQAGATTIGLHPADPKAAAGSGGQVAYWLVRDLERTLVHFEAHGCARFRGPIRGVDGARICQVQDPFGNLWGLLERG